MEKAGALERLIAPVIQVAGSVGAAVTATVAAVVATNIATADQYIAIVLPGRMVKGAFAQHELAPVARLRLLGAADTSTGALMPWNSCGAYMAATLGVATFHYLPDAVFNPASALLALALAHVGLRMSRVAPNPAEAPVAP